MARPANDELVTVAWLKQVSGLSQIVATQLPENITTWSSTGFVVVGPQVGGGPEMYVPRREPVMQVVCYAVNADSKWPPWDKATDLAEQIVDATFDASLLGKALTLRSGYRRAYVQAAWVLAGPRRIPDDDAGYAAMGLDLALAWIEVPES